ncbi:MAG TPA: adenylate/guanylate cyclase domain-containing protein [Candidatus Limnocylindria bacterium]
MASGAEYTAGVSDRPACPTCGARSPGGYRRCGACGAPLSVAAQAAQIRRQATIVTSDLKGSTALGERLDPESLREVMTTYIDAMSAVFESHGGRIEKIIGDAIVAVFGLPAAADGDALRAVEAAAESQRALASLNEQLDEAWGVRLTVRTGVASGDVVVGEASAGQHVLTGPTIALATAMEQNAPPQEVLLAASTHALLKDVIQVEPMGPVTPKGGAEPVETYRLIAVAERAAQAPAQDSGGSAKACQTCGADNPEDFRHCGTCGDVLRERARARDTRKTVSIVFADPKPMTADGSPPTPEALRDVMSRYFAAMQAALERHGGTVEKFIGDAVMAVFGLPIRHEDDALRAVRAASDMQRALPELNAAFEAEYGISLQNHIGVNTGEVVAGDASQGQRLVTGDTVNVAARLEQAAGAREVLLGGLTYRLVRDAVSVEPVEPLTLKGKAEPVPAYRLTGVSDVGATRRQRADTPMVGREQELAALNALLAQAVTQRACRLATVVGDAGVGKTRLIAEFTGAHAPGALVIRGRCLPYGDGITFWPLREAVREAAGISADDAGDEALAKLRARVPDAEVADRLASVIGLSQTPFPVPEVFWGARRFLEGMASERPVLMVVDDIHWAEATFLDLLGQLVQTVESAPVMLMTTSRHELLERHTDWAEADGMLRLVLAPLTDADAGQVVEGLLGGTGIDAAVRSRIVQAAAGNPLFVEQLLSMLIDDGTLRREDDHWVQVSDLTRLDVPPTIQALLAARLDLLEADERGVIEPASVIGQNFAVAAVGALVAEPIAPTLPQHLVALSDKQLVQPNAGADGEDAAYRFHHLLVRDAAYGGLLKRERAGLHERFVTWAEGFNAEHGVDNRDFEEIHGYHLEQAYRYLGELGTLGSHGRAVGVRASQKLAGAGMRAMVRGDLPAAASLLRRAAATRSEDDPDRLLLLPVLAEALTELGEFEEVKSVLGDALRNAGAAGDERIAHHARLVQLYAQLYSGETDGGSDWSSEVAAATEAAVPLFEATGYDRGLTFAWRMRVGMYGAAQQAAAIQEASANVVEHARASGDFRAETRGSIGYASALVYGPTPVAIALPRLEDLLAHTTADQHAASTLKLLLAQLRAMNGEFEEARSLYRSAAAKLEELRAGILAASISLDAARVELLAGDHAAAEGLLRREYGALREMGERYTLASIAGLLGRALLAQGKADDAAEVLAVAEEVSAPDDVDAQSIWRGAKARLLADGGHAAEAIALAESAVELREAGDFIGLRAEALRDLADVLRRAGEVERAERVRDEALALAEAKGDQATARQLRQGPGIATAGEEASDKAVAPR